MMPRLGAKYPIEFDIFSQPIAQYQTDAYFEKDLPVAPAVMVGQEIVVEGSDIAEDKLEAAICRHLGLAGAGTGKERLPGPVICPMNQNQSDSDQPI